MAVFTYTVTDPGGVDLSLFFPGTFATRWLGGSTSPTAGSSNYRVVQNGVAEESRYYSTSFIGTGFSFPSGDSGVAGRITSGSLTITEGLLPARQLATLSIVLGSGTAGIGGIDIAASMDMTPDTIMRFAARIDTGGASLIMNGGTGNDSLPGSDRADTLDGGQGADRLEGRGGDDLYRIDNASDVIVEAAGDGFDSLITTVSFGVSDAISIERLTAEAAAGGIDLTGNASVNDLVGNNADNRLDGGAGADTMSGLLGNDTYIVDNPLDIVNEVAGQGTDTVLASVSYTLGALASIEILRTASASDLTAIHLTGNAFGNQIFGNAGKNDLSGEAGNDRLDGGLGKDILTGGEGEDIFSFTTNIKKAPNLDKIADFNGPSDSIWLENSVFKGIGNAGSAASPVKLKAAAFFVGNAAHDDSDRVIYNKQTGALFHDADGTGPVAAIKFAQLSKGLTLKAGDFFQI